MAWCPSRENKSLIAAASKEGAGGGFDDVGGALEIYELDLSSSTENMSLRGAAKTPLKFETLAWAQFTAGGAHPAGILAGGMTDGSVTIWDPSSLINGSSQQPLTTIVGKHRSNVCALAFNPAANMSHILASGSSDNTVLLFDLNNPGSGEIAHYAPAEGDVTGHAAPVRAVAWNNEVGHILATAASDGVTSVWDLRAKRPWCHLRDPSGAPCSAISWNPNTGSGNVFLMTASDDDAKPVMRLWDLRKSTTTPMMELGGAHVGGHTRGIVSLNWCPYDEAIIVSSAKDKRTLFWDLFTCQVVEELDTTQGSPAGGGVSGGVGGGSVGSGGVGGGGVGGGGGAGGASPFGSQQSGFGSQQSTFGAGQQQQQQQQQQQASPFGAAPSSFGAGAPSSFGSGGNGVAATDSGVRDIVWSPSMPGVLACSTLGREMQVHGITAFKGNPQRAPKWLQRPGSASFGFGGKLVTCSKEGQNKVVLSSVTSEPELVQSASAFSDAMANNDFHNYCGYKVRRLFFLCFSPPLSLPLSPPLSPPRHYPAVYSVDCPTSLPTIETKSKVLLFYVGGIHGSDTHTCKRVPPATCLMSVYSENRPTTITPSRKRFETFDDRTRLLTDLTRTSFL